MANVVHPPSSYHYPRDPFKAFAQDYALDLQRELPKAFRAMPRVVLWGGREGDIQFGSPEYHEWVWAHRPRKPRFVWGFDSHGEELHHLQAELGRLRARKS